MKRFEDWATELADAIAKKEAGEPVDSIDMTAVRATGERIGEDRTPLPKAAWKIPEGPEVLGKMVKSATPRPSSDEWRRAATAFDSMANVDQILAVWGVLSEGEKAAFLLKIGASAAPSYNNLVTDNYDLVLERVFTKEAMYEAMGWCS